MVGPVQPWVGQKRHLTMAVYKDADDRWRFRTQIRLPDGSKVRVSGTAPKHDNTKEAAQKAERAEVHEALHPTVTVGAAIKKEVPTYSEWFKGRFWQEWVIGERNKPSERRSKVPGASRA